MSRSSAIVAKAQHGRTWPWVLVLLGLLGLALAGWWRFAPQTLPASLQSVLPAAPNAAPALYKWKDEQGQWHVTDVPPEGRSYEKVEIDPNLNVLPAGTPPEQD